MSMLTQNFVNIDDFMNFNTGSDASNVDPQLTVQYFGNLNEKPPAPMTLDLSTWEGAMDPRFTSLEDSQDFQLNLGSGENGHVAESSKGLPLEEGTTASKDIHTSNGRTGRKSSNESVPSLSSRSSDSPPATVTRQTRRKTTKTAKARESESRAKAPATKRQKTKKQAETAVANVVSEDEGDTKRSKYLERNRIAASKCRQKKKAWFNDLETQKSELKTTNRAFQRECTNLVGQVTQLKNDLMGHAGCTDPNIDRWLETEAKRFVQRMVQSKHDNGVSQAADPARGGRQCTVSQEA